MKPRLSFSFSRSVVSWAATAGCCALAHGQSVGSAGQSTVTVYGLLDAYLEHRSNDSAPGRSGNALNSGGMNTSRWGLRGQEDLGGGLKALFQLESEVALDSGNTGSAFWGRQANVGLEGRYGRLLAGRSYSTIYDFMLPVDPMGYAPVYSWATSAGATGGRKDGMITGVSNMLKYRVEFGGLRLGATYGFGEASKFSDRAVYAVAGSYTADGLMGVATAEQVNGQGAVGGGRDRTRAYHLGATYDFGGVKVFAAARQYAKDFAAGGNDNKSRTYWLGVSYLPMPAVTLTLAGYRQSIGSSNTADLGDDPLMLVFRARYALSKRTDLYGVLGRAKTDAGVVGLSRDDVSFGQSQTGIALGMQHRF